MKKHVYEYTRVIIKFNIYIYVKYLIQLFLKIFHTIPIVEYNLNYNNTYFHINFLCLKLFYIVIYNSIPIYNMSLTTSFPIVFVKALNIFYYVKIN